MRKIKFNKDFNALGNVNYIFSYNMMALDYKTKGDSIEGLEHFKALDGFMVFPYDADSSLYGFAECNGEIIDPRHCIIEKYKYKRY